MSTPETAAQPRARAERVRAPAAPGDGAQLLLRAIAAALDEELFTDDPLGDAPASESEESLDEVFAAFRERVDEEVSADDFRTHYDLGIGYKEMGLIDEAIEVPSGDELWNGQHCLLRVLVLLPQFVAHNLGFIAVAIELHALAVARFEVVAIDQHDAIGRCGRPHARSRRSAHHVGIVPQALHHLVQLGAVLPPDIMIIGWH